MKRIDEEMEEMLEKNVEPENEQVAGDRSSCCFWTRRYVGLAALCLLYFVVLVSYDCPGALQTSMMEEYSYTLFDFSRLMSSYSWSSVFCFLGGYFVDRVSGLNLGLCAFTTIFVLGNVLYTTGMFYNIFWVIILGRILAGLGGETIGALINCYVIHWFTDGTLNLAFALSNSFSQLAPAFTYQISHPLYDAIVDSTDDNRVASRQWSLSTASAIICGTASILAIACSGITASIYNQKEKITSIKGKRTNLDISGLDSLRSILTFKPTYWTATTFITLVYMAMYNFISLSQDYFINNHGLNVSDADDLISRYSLIIFVTSPVIGYLADRSGKNMLLLVISTLGSIISHTLLALTRIPPALPVMILAVSMSVFISSYSPLVGESVHPQQVATAYGITYAVVNAGYALGFMVAGLISDQYGYDVVEYFYLSLLIGALFFWTATWVLRQRTESKESVTRPVRQI